MRYSFLETRRVHKIDGQWWVFNEEMTKKLDGPFKTKKAAFHRLGQIEYFKHKEGKALPMKDVEVRALPLESAELRVKSGSKGPIIHGYAAVFDRDSQDLGGFIERIHPKAFNKALEKSDVRALANHDPGYLMGRQKSGTLKLEVDDRGLHMEISPPDTPLMQHFVRSIERGDMDGSSFSFTTARDEWQTESDPVRRTVHEVRDLFDVGPVTFPAYMDTTIGLRSLGLARRPDPRIYRQRLARVRLAFPSFSIPKG